MSALGPIAASAATAHWLSRAHRGRWDNEHLLVNRDHLVRFCDDDLHHGYHGLCDGKDRFRSRHDLLRCRKDLLHHQDPGLREIDHCLRCFDHGLRQRNAGLLIRKILIGSANASQRDAMKIARHFSAGVRN